MQLSILVTNLGKLNGWIPYGLNHFEVEQLETKSLHSFEVHMKPPSRSPSRVLQETVTQFH